MSIVTKEEAEYLNEIFTRTRSVTKRKNYPNVKKILRRKKQSFQCFLHNSLSFL